MFPALPSVQSDINPVINVFHANTSDGLIRCGTPSDLESVQVGFCSGSGVNVVKLGFGPLASQKQ